MSKFGFNLYHSRDKQKPKQFDNHLKWWALDTPDEGFIISLEKNGEVLAVSSVIFRPTGIFQNSERIAHFGHHFVDPSMRQKGVFTEMLKHLEELCINHGVKSFLVTPNKKSEGIYRAQNYILMDDIYSNLQLIDIYSVASRADKITLKEISSDDYFNTTADYPRLHQMDIERFKWRFSQPQTKYFFLSGLFEKDHFYIAFRKGKKGPVDVYVLTEIFLNGGKPSLDLVTTLVRKCLPEFSVPMPTKVITQSFTSNKGDKNIAIYRSFPFAIKHFGASNPDWVKRLKYYQFSDSDFG